VCVMKTRAQAPNGSPKENRRESIFAFLAILLIVAASVALSSCAGYTSASSSGGQTGDPSAGVLSPGSGSISFGNVAVGSTSSLTLSVTNTGTATVNVSSVTVSGAGFTLMSGGGATSVPVGQSASVQIQFAPASASNDTGTLTVASNASNSSLAIPLSGTGTQGDLSANPGSVSFGTVATGNSNSQTITLKNDGNAVITFSQIAVAGSGFSQTGLSTSSTIAAEGSLNFNAVFTPSSTGAVNGSITLTTNGTPSPLVINLSGTGATPTLLLGANPASLSFGNVGDGTSSSLTTTLTNSGNSNVTIASVAVTGAGFSASGVPSGTVLTQGQSVTLTVTFAPTSAGTVNGANVTITSNATDSPTAVGLSGTGTHSVLLQWTGSSTPGAQYNVFRGTSQGGEGTSPINPSPLSTTSYTDTNVTSGLEYFYTVEAVNSAGSSAPSNEASANVP